MTLVSHRRGALVSDPYNRFERMVPDVRTAMTVAILLLMAACGDNQKSETAPTYASMVGSDGMISFPKNFPTGYMFIGTWSVTAPSGEGEVHSVFARPADVSSFQKAGEFPDGAVLVKEVSGVRTSDLTTGKASWAQDRKTWFVMIKDEKGRFPGNPLWGDGWGWAQFDPADTGKQIATNYRTDCKSCHVPAKSSDWVFSYGYPVLGAKGQIDVPKNAPGVMTAPVAPSSDRGAQSMVSDASAGKQAFAASCGACHSTMAGGRGIGPSLAGVVGRKAGKAPNYDYSAEMRQSGVTWTPEAIGKHLQAPRSFIPGNRMGNLFPKGVQDPVKRRDIIAYLETLR